MAVVCLLTWANSVTVPFHFDDEQVILNNPDLSRPSVFTYAEKWLSFHGRPLSNATFMLNYQLHHFDPAGYHWVNIFIHFMSALAVYKMILLILLISGKPEDKHSKFAALCGALVFLVHPMQTESVTYLSQRMTSLSGLFFFWGYYFYLKYRQQIRTDFRNLILFAVFIILAFLSKQTALNIFPVIVVTELILFRKKTDRNIHIITAAVLAVVISAAAWLMGVETKDSALLSRSDYLFSQFPVILKYFSKILLPVNLNVDYDIPVYRSLFEMVPLLSFFALILIITGAWLIRKSHTVYTLGILFLLASLTLESTVFPIRDLMADHRIYTGLAGFSLIVSHFFYSLNRRPLQYIIIIATTGILSVLTITRNQTWQSPVSLWKDATEKSPGKSRPFTNLGFAYYNSGNLKEANRHYEKAVKINPADFAAWNNMGILAYEQKKYFKAIRCFRKSYSANNRYLPALNNIGKVLTDMKLHHHALFVFNHILHYNPNDNNIMYNKAICHENLNQTEMAEEIYLNIIASDPSFTSAAFNLGVIKMNQNKDPEAEYYFQYTVNRNPNDNDALNNLAIVYYRNGKKNDAIEILKRILKDDPHHTRARNNLNAILLENF